MTWTTGINLGLSLLNLLLLLGAIGFIKVKLVPVLKLIRGLIEPKTISGPGIYRYDLSAEDVAAGRFHPANPPKEDKTVIHLTAEHDSKVLGDGDE